MTFGVVVVEAYGVASRLAYVGWVGQALRRREAQAAQQPESGADAAFARFRGRARWLMRNDALALVAVCAVTCNTMGAWGAIGGAWDAHGGAWGAIGGAWDAIGGAWGAHGGAWGAHGGAWDAPLRIGIGLVLIVIGLGTKLWAARTLGDDAYYWHNFFVRRDHVPPDPPGPYRYLSNPMYTVGYLHAYGFALLLGSLPGLGLALFDQAAILIFHRLVEQPHYRRLLTAMESSPTSRSATG
jgi:protein-S-isoprenylcysteine O-methyltransferase Ste14